MQEPEGKLRDAEARLSWAAAGRRSGRRSQIPDNIRDAGRLVGTQLSANEFQA
jgi:hypothetical protein